jgi:hypothetical protein
MQNSCFSKIVYVQRSRSTGFSCYNVTPLPENHCSTLFTTGYKRLAGRGHSVFALGAFYFGDFLLLGLFTLETFGFLGEGRLFDVGDFGREKDAEGKMSC